MINRMIVRLLTLIIGFTLISAQAVERVTYVHNDVLGSPVLGTDENGDVLWRKVYLPFGESQQIQGYNEEISYTGKTEDNGTGLINFGARQYDPVLGQFIGVDPVGFAESSIHSFNKYTYVNNNPYSNVDPDGEFLETIFIDIPSLIISGTALVTNPGFANAAGFIYDLAATVVPGVPGGYGLSTKAVGAASDVAKSAISNVNPNTIRFSQSSVNGVSNIAESTAKNGFKG